MKKTLMAALAAATMIVGGQAAHAASASEQGGYVGGQYNFVSLDFDGVGKGKPHALTVLGGWNFNKYFAVEGRVGFGTDDDNLLGVDVKVESYVSVLARGTLPVNEMFNVYGIAGLTSGKAKLSIPVGSDSANDSGLSYGVGAELNFAAQHGVSIEYSRLLSGTIEGFDYDANALSVGYRYRF